MILLLWIVLLVLLAAARTRKNSRSFRLIEAIPGPPTVPLLGSIMEVVNVNLRGKLALAVANGDASADVGNRCAEYLQIVHVRWVRSYGDIYKVWIGHRPVVILSSPQLMEVTMSMSSYIFV